MKRFYKIITMICVFGIAFSAFAGCKKSSGGGSTSIQVDKSKTQLYVGVYNGGMGTRWLEEYKAGFEELYKDTSFESGKTGVEVVPLADKISYSALSLQATMSRSSVNVFFSEIVDYYKFYEDGLLMDITDAVTENLEGENKSIKDKLSDQLEGYFNIEGKYYGLPHYRAFRGIVYDKDLFNQKRLYIKSDGSVAGRATDSDLSDGPDGRHGTHDDGLPATYDEFFEWCDVVKNDKNIIPIMWNGANKESYTKHLQDALFADVEGADNANYHYNIPASDSAKSVSIITGFSGEDNTPIVEQRTISRDNYKYITQQQGVYYGFDFLDRIIKGNYYYSLSNNSAFAHEESHYDFLHSRFDPEKQPIAMLVEGTWWEEEADGIFKGMSDYEGASRSERNFGFLTLPKPNESFAGSPTLFDGNQSILMVNANCDAVHADLAKKFIKYISTDENLQKFNVMTGIGRDYEYTLSSDQYSQLTSFGKDIYDLVEASTDIAYPYATNYSSYQWVKTHSYDRFRAKLGDRTSNDPIIEFIRGTTAKAYFDGVIALNN